MDAGVGRKGVERGAQREAHAQAATSTHGCGRVRARVQASWPALLRIRA
jgi:hypothetical protein